MAYASLQGLTGRLTGALPRVSKVRLLFEPDKVVVVQGKVDARAALRATVGVSQAVEPGSNRRLRSRRCRRLAWLWTTGVSTGDAPAALLVRGAATRPGGAPGSGAGRHPGTDEVVLHLVATAVTQGMPIAIGLRPVRRAAESTRSSVRRRPAPRYEAEGAGRCNGRERDDRRRRGGRGRPFVVEGAGDGVLNMA